MSGGGLERQLGLRLWASWTVSFSKNKEKLRWVQCSGVGDINHIHILQRSCSSEWKSGLEGIRGPRWVHQGGS